MSKVAKRESESGRKSFGCVGLRHVLLSNEPNSMLIKLTKSLFFSIHVLLLTTEGYAEQRLAGIWIDSFHPGISTRSDVTALVSDLQRLNANSVFPEDVYYKSTYEPQAADVEADYDPLADLIEKAHASKKRPIEVHACMVMYPVWRGADGVPTQTNHPYRLHPDWLDQTKQGETFDGKDYAFDPGHPEGQQYLFNVVMDVVSNYDIDGLSLDYIHIQAITGDIIRILLRVSIG